MVLDFGVAGIAVICLGGLLAILKREATIVLGLLLTGLTIFVVTQKDIANWSCSFTSGCSLIRKGVDSTEETRGLIKAAVDNLNSDLERKFFAINEVIRRINSSGTTATSTLPAPQVSDPAPTRGAVLVFYRNERARAQAQEIAAALRGVGFASSATYSSLEEISRWVATTDPGVIQIAAAGRNQDLLSELKTIVGRSAPRWINTDDGWSFRSSVAQVYIF